MKHWVMKTAAVALALVAGFHGLQAEDYDWNSPKGFSEWLRVSLTSNTTTRVALKVNPKPSPTDNLNVYNHGKEELRAFTVLADVKGKNLKNKEWTEYSFKFTPRINGKVLLRLEAPWRKNVPTHDLIDASWVGIANVKVINAKIADGNFSSKRSLKTWQVAEPKERRLQAEWVKDSKAPGGAYIKFWTGCNPSQLIDVKKDKEVTVTFFARGFEVYHALR